MPLHIVLFFIIQKYPIIKQLDDRRATNLKQNGFKISKEQYKKIPMDGSLFVIKISW